MNKQSFSANKAVHFEIPTDDLERAKRFYGEIFGWQLNQMGPEFGNYVLASTVETDENQMPKESGAINGGLMGRSDKVKSPVLVMDVPNVEEHIRKIEAAGGKLVEGPMDIPGMGKYAYVNDTEGNVIGIFEYLKH